MFDINGIYNFLTTIQKTQSSLIGIKIEKSTRRNQNKTKKERTRTREPGELLRTEKKNAFGRMANWWR